jgi:hypothetical protein
MNTMESDEPSLSVPNPWAFGPYLSQSSEPKLRMVMQASSRYKRFVSD